MASATTIFTVHAGRTAGGPSAHLIPHRFSWAGFWFGPLWLAAARLWLAAAVVAAFDLAIALAFGRGLIAGLAALALWILGSALVGLEGREWRRRALARRGSALAGFAFGADEIDAVARAAGPPAVQE